MRKVSPSFILSAVGLYGLGLAHDVGAAYGLPSDGRDHSAPVALAAQISTGTGNSISYYATDTVTGVDLSNAPRYQYFKFTQKV